MDGARVKEIREKLQMTQEELAHAIGTTVTTVNRWENGKHKVSRFGRRALEELQEKRRQGK